MLVTQGLVEQHIHGAFGYDFMQCTTEEIIKTAELLAQQGVTAFFPTIMTDDINVIKSRVAIVKQAIELQSQQSAKISGIHLEGPFINPEKSGIHEKKYILPLSVDLYKQIEDDCIKIVTLAPELDENNKLTDYLLSKNVKVSAGHCIGSQLSKVSQVTHLYNAMGSFSHRGNSTVVSALSNDNLYTELIADSMHVSDEVLKLTFKLKTLDKILLISDALPLAHSSKTEHIFAGQTIFNKNGKLINKDGVFAGSSMLLCDIVKNLADKNILKLEDAIALASSNQLKYHNLSNNLKVYWNEQNKIEKVEFIN
ncbi:amidohydrolase family protein [bacterium]|nr:amidohydrolase family protein [bacterium]